MLPEDKARWVAALRSGEYKQGIGQLRTKDNKHCCLGVCLDVLRPSQWIRTMRNDEWGDSDGDSVFMLSTSTAMELDLREEDLDALATMNDDEGKDFNEIASWIEDNHDI